jgi:pSer/pThr/pTyr-binding forkhead associated (FHA) protein
MGSIGQVMRDDLYSAICREALESRQRDVMSFVDNGMSGMSIRLEKTLLRLPSGYYLLGLGPYNAGLVKLDFEELLIGREVPEFIGVGMPVSGFRVSSPDAFLNTEVSRLHAKVFRRGTESHREYRLVDMRSSCGTYLNGDPVPVPDDLAGISENDCALPLKSGDFFSLGPSAVNLFLFFQK